MGERHSKAARAAHLTRKQAQFVKAYAKLGNGTAAARQAGYQGSDTALSVTAHRTLRSARVKPELDRELARVESVQDYSANRVKRRLDRLSHGAEGLGQFGVAVRAEELIGRAAGMFVEQSLTLTANLSADHLAALIAVARQRQQEPLDLGNSRDTERDRLRDA
jgi:hypothetical protein